MPDTHGVKRDGGVAVAGVLVGLVYLVIAAAQGKWAYGAVGFVIVGGCAGLMYGLRRRSEPAQLLSGNPADERQAAVLLRASALTGQLLTVAVVVGMFVGLAFDWRYTGVFSALACGAGVCFIGSTVWFSRRG